MAKRRATLEQHFGMQQVADLLGVSRRTVDRLKDGGDLRPWVLIGCRPMFPESTILKFLESRRVG